MSFPLWQHEDGSESEPNPKQQLLWIEDMPDEWKEKHAHFHDLDVVAHSGSAGSGKSDAAIVRSIFLALKYPGISIIFGSINFKHLWKSVINQGFKEKLSTKYGPWKHPWVFKPPSPNSKDLIINPGEGLAHSTISFVNFSEPKTLLSMKANLVVVEEAQLLGSSEALEIMITRMRGQVAPFRQIILNFNPDADDIGWLWDWFLLERFDPDFEGDRDAKIGKPCVCHLCNRCILPEGGAVEVEFKNGKCPKCGWEKETECPGNQHFQRVIRSTMYDNLKNQPASFAGDVLGSLSAEKAAAYGAGIVRRQPGGVMYESYGKWNNVNEPLPIDPNKDLIWHLDFNLRPQCSGISQVHWENGLKHVYLKDEIIEWNADIDKVAAVFIKRYRYAGLNKKIRLHGDPNGHKKVDADMFIRLKKALDAIPEFHGRVVIMTPATQYRIFNRVKALNRMLKDADGLVRIHIGPKAVYHRLSLAGTKWNKAGTKEDERDDVKARERGKPGDQIAMTHPAAGFGYYILEAFPLVEDEDRGDAPIFISLDPRSGNCTSYESDGSVNRRYLDEIDDEDDENEEEEEIEEEEIEEVEEDPRIRIAREQDRLRKMPIAAQLRQQGLWNLPSY